MGGREDAYIHFYGFMAANPVELPFRQHPQQPRLQCGRAFTDLVQEQGAPVGLLETAQRAGNWRR